MADKQTQNNIINLTDDELMKLVVKKDELAFEVILRRHEDHAFSLAFKIVNDSELARDVTQEVFISIWENPSAWKPNAKFSTWLYRVTYNRSLNSIRSRNLRSFFSFSDPTTDNLDTVPKNPAPDQELIDDENQGIFNSAFDDLPARQRAALHLRYRENLSVGDVAKSLKVTYKSAEALIFRGRKALRDSLVD